MAYTKTLWKDRLVEKPLTFNVQNNPDGTITLMPAEGQVIEAGTPIIANNMNNIEQGIENAHTQIDAHKAENTKLWSDYDYPLATIVGTQIRVTHESNSRVVKFELAEGVTGGEITVSLDDGATEKPLVDITNEPITELDKGFVEVIESEDFFTLAPRGGKLESPFDSTIMELQPVISASGNSATEWQEAIRIENPYGGIIHALAVKSNASYNTYYRAIIDGIEYSEFTTNNASARLASINNIMFDNYNVVATSTSTSLPFKNSFILEFLRSVNAYPQVAVSYSLATKKIKQYTFYKLQFPVSTANQVVAEIFGKGKIYDLSTSSLDTYLDIYLDGIQIGDQTLRRPYGDPTTLHAIGKLENTASALSTPIPPFTFKEGLVIRNRYETSDNITLIVALED